MHSDLTRRQMLRKVAGAAALAQTETGWEHSFAGQTGALSGPEVNPGPPRKIALLGLAHIHTPSFVRLITARTDVRVVKVWDHQTRYAQELAGSLNAAACSDRKEIWDDPEMDAVIILSETVRHRELVTEAALARKNIFVEKPLGIGTNDAMEMAAAIGKAGVLFQTGYAMRGEPVYLFLREQIQKGLFGKITRVRLCVSHAGGLDGMFAKEYSWMTDPRQTGVGGFGDIGTHALDLLIWYFGDVARVTAGIQSLSGKQDDGNENGEAVLEFRNGVTAVISSGWLDWDNPMPVYIGGTGGCAYKIKDRFYFQCDQVEGADGRRAWNKFPQAWAHPLDLFLDAVGGKKEVPLVKVKEAAACCRVMEALYRAAAERTWLAVT